MSPVLHPTPTTKSENPANGEGIPLPQMTHPKLLAASAAEERNPETMMRENTKTPDATFDLWPLLWAAIEPYTRDPAESTLTRQLTIQRKVDGNWEDLGVDGFNLRLVLTVGEDPRQ